MTATVTRAPNGRFTARPPLVCCESCGRVLFENLAAELLCVWQRCGLARQVVGTSGADAGTLSAPSPSEEPSSGHGDPGAPSDALTGLSGQGTVR